MPNWCVGVIKVRGKKNDVFSFLENEILKMNYTGLFESPKSKNIKMEDVGYGYLYKLNDDKKEYFYLNNSTRCFIEQNEIEIYNYSDTDENETYVTLKFKQAWDVEEDLFEKLSEKYNIDFNIYASERGMEFERYITLIKGEFTRIEIKKYDDFYFEAINPELGG
jgi:hypothetical protein|nr:MAG TPA: Ferredoxin-like domain in Api92-like protein [Caudoviricetes sp.]